MSFPSPELRKGALAVGGALLIYVGLAWALSSAAIAPNPVAPRGEIQVDFGPNRLPGTALSLHKAGFEYQCSECHMDQPRHATPRTFVGEHSTLAFDHGANDRCFNCHHPDPDLADQFVTRDGRPLPFTEHVALCASCHGVVHRDWLRGAHGRRQGYWDRRKGEAERTDCVICHDPHHPVFAPIAPLPPPGVVRGPARPGLAPHGAVPHLLNTPVAPVPDTLRGPAIDPDDAPAYAAPHAEDEEPAR